LASTRFDIFQIHVCTVDRNKLYIVNDLAKWSSWVLVLALLICSLSLFTSSSTFALKQSRENVFITILQATIYIAILQRDGPDDTEDFTKSISSFMVILGYIKQKTQVEFEELWSEWQYDHMANIYLFSV